MECFTADFLAFVRKVTHLHVKVTNSQILLVLIVTAGDDGSDQIWPESLQYVGLCFFSSPFQIFTGNQNHDTPEMRSFGTLLTRFIRIYPEKATTEGLGLRLEFLGCDLEGGFRCKMEL